MYEWQIAQIGTGQSRKTKKLKTNNSINNEEDDEQSPPYQPQTISHIEANSIRVVKPNHLIGEHWFRLVVEYCAGHI